MVSEMPLHMANLCTNTLLLDKQKKRLRGDFRRLAFHQSKGEVLAVPIFDALHADPQHPISNDISVEINAGGGEIIM